MTDSAAAVAPAVAPAAAIDAAAAAAELVAAINLPTRGNADFVFMQIP